MKTGVLLLAAGRSRRFGSDKRRAPLPDGRPMLDATLAAIQAAGLPVRVCLAPEDRQLGEPLACSEVSVTYCQRSAAGMGATLAEGMASIEGWQGVLIALADMPLVRPETYRRLAQVLSPAAICVPTWGGTRGNPVAFGSDYFSALRQLSGDRGARRLLQGDPGAVREIAVRDPGVLTDIDTRSDLSLFGTQTGPGRMLD